MKLCPGRVSIEIDRHKLFNESAAQVIGRKPSEYGDQAMAMSAYNTIIRIEAAPINKPMPPVVSYHYDIELAIKDCLNQIKIWQQQEKR